MLEDTNWHDAAHFDVFMTVSSYLGYQKGTFSLENVVIDPFRL